LYVELLCMDDTPDVPRNQGIDTVKKLAEEHPNIDVGVSNSGGQEMKCGESGREWIKSVVEQNHVRFDNPARINAGHSYILVLPEE